MHFLEVFAMKRSLQMLISSIWFYSIMPMKAAAISSICFVNIRCLHMRHGQWLAVYPDKPTTGRSFRPGLRSERKALLQVLLSLWRNYQSQFPGVGEVSGLPVAEYVELLADEVCACAE